jgi:hypothetical protein
MSNDSRGNGANSGGSNSGRDRMAELRQIVEALFEERASAAEIARLDQLVIADSACRKFYLESIDLHGNLYWDAAQAGAEPVPVATPIPERPSRRRRDSLESLIDAPLRPDLRPDRRGGFRSCAAPLDVGRCGRSRRRPDRSPGCVADECRPTAGTRDAQSGEWRAGVARRAPVR